MAPARSHDDETVPTPPVVGPSLRRRGVIAGALVGVVLVVTAVVALLAVRTQDRDLQEVRGVLVPARTEVGTLEAALLDQQAALRGYVITEDPEASALFETARSREKETVLVLDELLSGNAQLGSQLDDVVGASEAWALEVATPVLDDVENGDPERAGERIDTVGADLFQENLRPEVAELREAIDEELVARDKALDDANNRLAVVLMVAVGLVAGIFIALGLLLRRWVVRPIEELDAAVRPGGPATTMPTTGPSEIVRVGAEADALRRRAVQEERAALSAREALAERAPAVRAVQAALEPTIVAFPPGLDIAGRVRPAEGVLAGDWFEFVDLEAGRAAFAVADVSGHGVIPGVVALRAKQLVPAGLRLGMEPGEFLGWMDGELGDMGEFFLTAFVGVIDASTRRCTYANAGHPAAVVVGRESYSLAPTGPLLGSLDATWRTESTMLPDPSLLIVTTDGVIDARNTQREIFGEERFLACFDFESHTPTSGLADFCLDQVSEFVGGRLVDDATIVVARLDQAGGRQ